MLKLSCGMLRHAEVKLRQSCGMLRLSSGRAAAYAAGINKYFAACLKMVMSDDSNVRDLWFIHPKACVDVCRHLLGDDCIFSQSWNTIDIKISELDAVYCCMIELRNSSTEGNLIFGVRDGTASTRTFKDLNEFEKIICEIYRERTKDTQKTLVIPTVVNKYADLMRNLMETTGLSQRV